MTISSFCVAGLSARTNNAVEATSQGKIPQIWSLVMQGSLANQLLNKVGDELYAVYSDYESDYTGDYTFLLGHRVSSPDNLPDGVTACRVPNGEFSVFTSEQGPAWVVVPALWQKIWTLTPDQLQGTRAYQVDFEVYDHRAANPSFAQVDLFIGLRPR
jgi:predicted transcriptional regulator YdeE